MKKTAYLVSCFALGSGIASVVFGISDSNRLEIYLGLLLTITGLLNIIVYEE